MRHFHHQQRKVLVRRRPGALQAREEIQTSLSRVGSGGSAAQPMLALLMASLKGIVKLTKG